MTDAIKLPDYHIRFRIVEVRKRWFSRRRRLRVEAEWSWWGGPFQSAGEHWLDEGDTLTMKFPLEMSGEAGKMVTS